MLLLPLSPCTLQCAASYQVMTLDAQERHALNNSSSEQSLPSTFTNQAVANVSNGMAGNHSPEPLGDCTSSCPSSAIVAGPWLT